MVLIIYNPCRSVYHVVITPQPPRAPGYCRPPREWAGGWQVPLAFSRPYFFRIICKRGIAIDCPKISEEHDYELIIIIIIIIIELIRCLSDIFCRVWVRLNIFCLLSIIQFIIQYVGLCVFSLPTPLVMIEIIYILCLIIIIKSEVWTSTHCLGLGHETTVCAVCLSIFLWRFWLIRYAHNRLFNDLNKVGLPGPTCQVKVIKFGTNVGLNILIDMNYRFYDNHEESFSEFLRVFRFRTL